VGRSLKLVNEECAVMNEWVEVRTKHWLDQGKLVGLVGGDHSTPLGYFRALAARHPRFGILHIDAHMDLRKAYEGFTFSHASIMRNALAIPQLSALVQVGIRDFCEEENNVLIKEGGRVNVVRSADIRRQQFDGVSGRSNAMPSSPPCRTPCTSVSTSTALIPRFVRTLERPYQEAWPSKRRLICCRGSLAAVVASSASTWWKSRPGRMTSGMRTWVRGCSGTSAVSWRPHAERSTQRGDKSTSFLRRRRWSSG
jgi:hypothetical protein